jgi:iron complex transport system ATP-binding protein
MASLTMINVGFRYNGSFHLDNLTLQISAGDFFGIIGPNGSGKSTMIKLLAGYLRPQQGSVELTGFPLQRMERKEVARKIAVVPQGLRTDFDFTVEEMVALGRLPWQRKWQNEAPGDKAAIDRAMEITQVEKFRHRPVTKLSGGEAQRVLVAQAIAQDPQALLLDEPTTYMDLAHQQELFSLMTKLNSQGITIVAVLHDINLAALYCKNLAAMKAGRLVAKGTVEEVVTQDNIKEIFGLPVGITRHPNYDRPQITMLPGAAYG